jgi:NDP-sugar pyrophosphorylase family protein
MRAVILAGGRGTRLRPYTATLPKPLVPFGDRAILEVVLMQLRRAGVTRVTMAVSHLAHLIRAYFGDGQQWGLKIDYSLEDRPLSTIAPLKLIQDLPETFFVMNGDVVTDLDFRALYQYHQDHDADITVATFERDAKIDFGVLKTDSAHRVVGFQEKPVFHFTVAMGVNVLSRRLLKIIPDNAPFGFDDLMMACVEKKCRALNYPHTGCWLDIGRPSDYDEASAKVEELMKRLFPEGGSDSL